MIQTITTKKNVFINTAHVVKIEIHPFPTREPDKTLDCGDGEIIRGKVTGESFTMSIKTVDGETHKLDEKHSAVARDILMGALGTEDK